MQRTAPAGYISCPLNRGRDALRGLFSNERAREKPDLAHAIIIENNDKSYRISVRAPLNRRKGADTLCRAFPTGGGRVAAAGINALPVELLDDFVNSFIEVFAA